MTCRSGNNVNAATSSKIANNNRKKFKPSSWHSRVAQTLGWLLYKWGDPSAVVTDVRPKGQVHQESKAWQMHPQYALAVTELH